MITISRFITPLLWFLSSTFIEAALIPFSYDGLPGARLDISRNDCYPPQITLTKYKCGVNLYESLTPIALEDFGWNQIGGSCRHSTDVIKDERLVAFITDPMPTSDKGVVSINNVFASHASLEEMSVSSCSFITASPLLDIFNVTFSPDNFALNGFMNNASSPWKAHSGLMNEHHIPSSEIYCNKLNLCTMRSPNLAGIQSVQISVDFINSLTSVKKTFSLGTFTTNSAIVRPRSSWYYPVRDQSTYTAQFLIAEKPPSLGFAVEDHQGVTHAVTNNVNTWCLSKQSLAEIPPSVKCSDGLCVALTKPPPSRIFELPPIPYVGKHRFEYDFGTIANASLTPEDYDQNLLSQNYFGDSRWECSTLTLLDKSVSITTEDGKTYISAPSQFSFSEYSQTESVGCVLKSISSIYLPSFPTLSVAPFTTTSPYKYSLENLVLEGVVDDASAQFTVSFFMNSHDSDNKILEEIYTAMTPYNDFAVTKISIHQENTEDVEVMHVMNKKSFEKKFVSDPADTRFFLRVVEDSSHQSERTLEVPLFPLTLSATYPQDIESYKNFQIQIVDYAPFMKHATYSLNDNRFTCSLFKDNLILDCVFDGFLANYYDLPNLSIDIKYHLDEENILVSYTKSIPIPIHVNRNLKNTFSIFTVDLLNATEYDHPIDLSLHYEQDYPLLNHFNVSFYEKWRNITTNFTIETSDLHGSFALPQMSRPSEYRVNVIAHDTNITVFTYPDHLLFFYTKLWDKGMAIVVGVLSVVFSTIIIAPLVIRFGIQSRSRGHTTTI